MVTAVKQTMFEIIIKTKKKKTPVEKILFLRELVPKRTTFVQTRIIRLPISGSKLQLDRTVARVSVKRDGPVGRISIGTPTMKQSSLFLSIHDRDFYFVVPSDRSTAFQVHCSRPRAVRKKRARAIVRKIKDRGNKQVEGIREKKRQS